MIAALVQDAADCRPVITAAAAEAAPAEAAPAAEVFATVAVVEHQQQ